jgi:WD40 repeat protein
MLLVSSINSCHYLYSLAALDQPPVATLTGHRTDSFCVKSCFSPCGQHVLSGSSDKRAYIWDVSGQPGGAQTSTASTAAAAAVLCGGPHASTVVVQRLQLHMAA